MGSLLWEEPFAGYICRERTEALLWSAGLAGPTHQSPCTTWTSTSASEGRRTGPTSSTLGSHTTSIMGCRYWGLLQDIQALRGGREQMLPAVIRTLSDVMMNILNLVQRASLLFVDKL